MRSSRVVAASLAAILLTAGLASATRDAPTGSTATKDNFFEWMSDHIRELLQALIAALVGVPPPADVAGALNATASS